MKIDHIAVSSNSEVEADKFFNKLLGLKQIKSFMVSDDLMEQFFGVRKEQKIVRYGNDEVSVEVFITDENNQAYDKFTHNCLIIEDRISLIEKARKLNIEVIQVSRKDSENFYLFLKDSYGNLFEIKS
jgi:catechol 2,3-dioxygenase-like lactoylglutathione lyase family enzyme